MTERKFKYKSAFDIIGPIMVGPSSSHTAGAVKIGNMARELYKRIPKKLIVTFFGSFAETYKGHGTAVAIVAGVLGFETNDERIPDAIKLAEEQGIAIEFLTSTQPTEHANTVNLELIDEQDRFTLTAISIGGGSIQLLDINYYLTTTKNDEYNGLVVTSNQPLNSMVGLKDALESPVLTEIQQLSYESIYFVETVSDISHTLIVKLRKIPGITTVLPTTG